METGIGWTVTASADGVPHGGFTFNGWSGCTKYSAGCANCYAAALPPKMRRGAVWGPEAERVVAPDSYWRNPFTWARRAARLGVRLKVFAQSVSDWCEEREDLHGPRMRLLALACLTRDDLDWLLLTKRAAHMRAVLDLPELVEQVVAASAYFVELGAVRNPLTAAEVVEGLARLWLGVSVENQKAADERVPELIAVRAGVAAVRFLSCEPLLGAVVLQGLAPGESMGAHEYREWLGEEDQKHALRGPSPIAWVIVGGESGDRARPMHPDWARQLIAQCDAARVPVFFKQWGEWAPRPIEEHPRGVQLAPSGEVIGAGDGRRGNYNDTTASVWLAQIGKAAAGREIDGRTFDGFPNTSDR